MREAEIATPAALARNPLRRRGNPILILVFLAGCARHGLCFSPGRCGAASASGRGGGASSLPPRPVPSLAAGGGDPPPLATRPRTRRQISQLIYVMTSEVETMIRSDRSPPTAAVAKARDNLQRLRGLYEETGDEAYLPNTAVMNSLTRALAKSRGRREAAEEAERILNDMKAGSDGGGYRAAPPDVYTYTAVIDAYARSGGAKWAAIEAERVLFDMMDGGAERFSADGSSSATEDVSAAANAVMNCWARCRSREGAERAQAILERMKYLRTRGSDELSIRPTTYSFSTAISAWKNSGVGEVEAAERAETLLQNMVDLAENDADGAGDIAKPNTVCFNSVIDCWSRCGTLDAVNRTEELLKRMEEMTQFDVTPDEVTYNTIINAYSNCGDKNAARSAAKILERMTANGVNPSRRTYNTLLKAHAKNKDPRAARQILDSMIEAYKAGDEEAGPDVVSFGTVTDAWAKSAEWNKAKEAKSTVDDLLQFWMEGGSDGAKPNIFPFNAVLNACAFSAMAPDNEERKQALLIAVKTFSEIRAASYINADTVTYGMMLKCIGNLVPVGNTQNQMALQIFSSCADDGLVGELVLREAKKSLTLTSLDDLIGDHSPGMNGIVSFEDVTPFDLPQEWRSNMNRRGRRRSKEPRKRAHGRKNARDYKDSRSRYSVNKKGMETQVRIVETSWQTGRDL